MVTSAGLRRSEATGTNSRPSVPHVEPNQAADDGSSDDDRRTTLSTLIMSDAPPSIRGESESENGDSGDNQPSQVGSSDQGSGSDASDRSSDAYSSSPRGSQRSSSALGKRPARTLPGRSSSKSSTYTSVVLSSPAQTIPPAAAGPSTTPPSSTPRPRRFPAKRHHFDSPQYRSDAFFDPHAVPVVRSPRQAPAAASAAEPALAEDGSSRAAPPPPPLFSSPPQARPAQLADLQQLIAASTPLGTPRATPRRARRRPTESFEFLSRSPHPLALQRSAAGGAPSAPASLNTEKTPAIVRESKGGLDRVRELSASPDFPDLSVRPRRPPPAPPSSTHAAERVSRRKSGRCSLPAPAEEQREVIELSSGSDDSGMPSPAVRRDKGKRRLVVLSDSDDEEAVDLLLQPSEAVTLPVLPPARPSPKTPPVSPLVTGGPSARTTRDDDDGDGEQSSPPVRTATRRKPARYLDSSSSGRSSGSSSSVSSSSRSDSYEDKSSEGEPEESDSDDGDGVLRYSPPPPPKRTTVITPAPRKPLFPAARQPTTVSPASTPLVSPTKRRAPKRPPANADDPDAPQNVNTKAWKERRAALALALIRELDRDVFDGRVLPALRLDALEEDNGTAGKKDPRGVSWTARLKSTAGISRWTRRMVGGVWEDRCGIELSTKVLDTEAKVLNTTAHELCHVAVWIFHGKAPAPHGKEFHAFGRKVQRARPDLTVTTKHSYEIVRKYSWSCTTCGAAYARDSKSIDVTKHVCGKCKGPLVADFAAPAQPTAWTQFVQAHFARVQADLGGAQAASRAGVMRELGVRYRAGKAGGAGPGEGGEGTGPGRVGPEDDALVRGVRAIVL